MVTTEPTHNIDAHDTPLDASEQIDTKRPVPASSDMQQPNHRAWVPKVSRTLYVTLGMLAYALALLGTLQLQDPSSRGRAVLLLLLSGVFGLLAWRKQPWAAPFGARLPSYPLARWQTRRAISFAGVLAAAGFSWFASVQWKARPAETFGAAGWFWLLSIAMLIASTAAWPRTDIHSAAPQDRSWRGALAQVLSALPWVRSSVQNDVPVSDASPNTKVSREQSQPWTYWEVALFAGIAVLACVTRIWDLTHFPFAIHSDEIITGRVATTEFGGPTQIPVFSTTWYGIDLPALWFKGVQVSLAAGGNTLASLRLPAALFGAATVFPIYGLIRGVWGRAAAIAGALIIAVSASNVHFSRVTLNNIVTPFFWALCFYFLLKGLRTRRPLYWALAGLSGGLSEHFYYGTRLLFVILIVFAVYLLVVHWRQGWTYLGHFALLALGFIVGFGPLLAYFLNTPGLYFGRGAGVLTWNHIPTSWDDLVLMWNTLWPLMQKNLLTFSTIPGNDSVYFAPLLLPLEAALLALGTALLIWRWRHPAAFLMLLSGLGVLFAGGTLVPGPGFIAHWTPAFPAFYVALAVPVGMWFESGWKVVPGKWRLFVPATIAAVLAIIAFTNIDFYFNHYYAIRPEFEIRAFQSRVQADLGTGYIVRNVGTTWQPYDPETNSYLIKGQDGAQIIDPSRELPVSNPEGKGLAFFFLPDNQQYLPLVQSLYPGGTEEEYFSHDGKTHLFYVYRLTPEQVRGNKGPVTLEPFLLTGRSPHVQSHLEVAET